MPVKGKDTSTYNELKKRIVDLEQKIANLSLSEKKYRLSESMVRLLLNSV